MGLGADTACLPTLLAARLLPGVAATIITIIGSASSAHFANPFVFNPYFITSRISGCWWDVGFGPDLFLLVGFFVVPLHPFKVFEKDSENGRIGAGSESLPFSKCR